MTNDADNKPTEKDEIEADIVRTREELAETVDAIAARMDVKTRTKDRLQQTTRDASAKVAALRDQATDDQGRPTPATLAVAGAVTVAILLVVLGRRRRR